MPIENLLGDLIFGVLGTALRDVLGAPLADTFLNFFGTALGAVGIDKGPPGIAALF